jgi:hypothetical protein
MNIREMARQAKVSTATVSRTINRHPGVQPRLAKRALKVVEELGYFPSMQARALVSGRSRMFGLIVPEITNPFFSSFPVHSPATLDYRNVAGTACERGVPCAAERRATGDARSRGYGIFAEDKFCVARIDSMKEGNDRS